MSGQPTDDSPRVQPDTLEFIYQQTRGGPERQHRDMTELDGKTVQLLAAGSVILGLATFAGKLSGDLEAGLTAGALALYVGVALLSLWQLLPTEAAASSYAGTLWDEHWQSTPDQIRHAIVADIQAAYRLNDGILRCKAAKLRWIVRLLAGETALVAISVLMSRV